MLKKFIKKLALFIGVLVALAYAAPVLAYYPTLTANWESGGVRVSVSQAQPSSQVSLYYTPAGSSLFSSITNIGQTDYSGYFSQVIYSNDLNSGSVQMYVTVGGQQSGTVSVGGSGSGCGYYGCTGSLSLSQNSISLNSGQNVTVTAYNAGSLYIASNSNSSVASASISGSQIYIYGNSTGSASIQVCSGSYGSTVGCATVYVTVNSGGCGYSNCGGGSLSLSQTSVSLNVGQNVTVTAYNAGNIYIANNSNSAVASASVSGNQIYVYGNSAGSATLNVCSSGNYGCASLYVTVGGCGNYNCGGNSISFSQNNPTVNTNQSLTVSIYGGYSGSYYISNNSNSAVLSANVSGSTLNLYGLNPGSATLTVCQSGSGQCGTLYVTVQSYSSGGSVSLSPSSVVMTVGQSSTVYASGSGNSNFYISQNGSPSVVSASISGSTVTLYALSQGTSALSICQYGNSNCGYLSVSVLGGGSGSVYFSPSNPTLSVGQTMNVSVYGSNSSYGNYYVSSNSNSSVATATLGGNQLTLYGNSYGATSITVCQNYNNSMCGTLYVTVSGGGGSGTVYFSPSNPTVQVGQTASVSVYSTNSSYGSYYISSNSNSGAVSASLSGSTLNLYGASYGSSTITVCQNYNSLCGTLYVNVGSGGGSGNLYFSGASLPQPTVGQYYSQQLQVSGGSYPYNFSVTSGSLPAGLTLSSSGQIFGTPQNTQTASFAIRAADSYGRWGSANFSLTPACGSGSCVLGANQYGNGTLISENGTVYIVYKNTKTPFANASAFLGLGYKFTNVVSAPYNTLSYSGYTVQTANTVHPWGSWIKSGSTIYFVGENGLIPIPTYDIFLNNGGQDSLVVPMNSYDSTRQILYPMTYGDTRLR